MLEIVYYVASSIDGFIADASGGIEWLSEFEGGEDYGYSEFYSTIDALLMGRRTYEQVLTFGEWPHSDRPTWVFSNHALTRRAEGVTAVAGAPRDAISDLDRAGIRRAWLVGGGELAGSFAREGLIARYIVSVMPVLLGNGVRLLGEQGARGRLVLEATSHIGEVVQNVYGYARTRE